MLHAQERDAPADRDALDWKLITNLPVCSRDDAIEKLHWYAMRWRIETFHKILKSGCMTCIAKLGGYLARKGDPPPGNMVMWRGMTRLVDIVLGLSIAKEIVGN